MDEVEAIGDVNNDKCADFILTNLNDRKKFFF